MKSLFTPTWRILVALIFLSGIGVLILPNSSVVSQIPGYLRFKGVMGGLNDYQVPGRFATLSPETRLLIRGKDNTGSPQSRWKAVHSRNPDSPLHYARYVQQIDILPPEFRATVSQLAPDNGWFDLIELDRTTSNAYSQLKQKNFPKDEWDRYIPEFEIIDADRLQEALDLFHRAASKAQFTNYGEEMHQLILNELKSPETWFEEVAHRTHVLSISPEYQSVISSANFLGAGVRYLIAQDDQDGFLRLENSILSLAPKLYADTSDLIGGLILQAWLRSAYQNLEIGSQHFGLTSRTEKYHNLRDRLESNYKERKRNRNRPEQEELFRNHGSIIVQLASPLISTPASEIPTKEDLLPSARAEHAVAARLFTFGWFLIFTFLALDLWLMSRKQTKLLSQNSQPSGCSTPWKMLLFGVIIPFFILFLIRYLTPLGGLQYSASSSKFKHLAIPLTASGLIIWACISVAAGFFTSDHRNPARWLQFVLLPTLPVILIGFYHPFDKPRIIVSICGLLLLTSMVWTIIRALLNFRRKDPALHAQRQLALPCVLLAAGLFGLSTWGLTIEERAWIAKDDFGSPDGAFITKHEGRLVKFHLTELEELLP